LIIISIKAYSMKSCFTLPRKGDKKKEKTVENERKKKFKKNKKKY